MLSEVLVDVLLLLIARQVELDRFDSHQQLKRDLMLHLICICSPHLQTRRFIVAEANVAYDVVAQLEEVAEHSQCCEHFVPIFNFVDFAGPHRCHFTNAT